MKITNFKNSKKGVSLLELLIYLAVFSVIVVFLASIFPVLLRSRATANARFEVQENLRFGVEKIQQSVLDQSFIEVAGACPLNTVNVGTGLATTTFQVSGGVLQMREGAASPFQNITSSLVSVSGLDAATCIFAKISNPSPAKPTLQVKLKVSYNDQGRDELKFSDSAQVTTSLR